MCVIRQDKMNSVSTAAFASEKVKILVLKKVSNNEQEHGQIFFLSLFSALFTQKLSKLFVK